MGFRMLFDNREKGFTLVEVLMIIAILGILAVIAMPNLVSFIDTSDIEAAATELDVMQLAATAYMADNKEALPTADGSADAITSVIDDYLIGGIADVAYATYYIDDDGIVTRTVPPVPPGPGCGLPP